MTSEAEPKLPPEELPEDLLDPVLFSEQGVIDITNMEAQ